VRAYVLVNVCAGEERELLRVLENVPGILRTDLTLGPYDVIAELEAPDVSGIGRLVTDAIRSANNVVETVTCLVIETT
jgi:DNA-binding Lrp family transcriptional regulator